MKKTQLFLIALILQLAIGTIFAQDIFNAIKTGNLVKVKELIGQNSQLLNSKDGSGNTPLHEALANKYNDISEFLINAGSNVNAKSNSNETPLHIAAKFRAANIVKLLISKGALINVNDAANFTPLTNAIHHYNSMNMPGGKLETIKILLEGGANTVQRGMWGWLPIQVAAEFGSPDVVDYLIEKGVDIPVQQGEESYQILNASCSRGLTKLFDKLLEKGFDLQANQYTRGLLHLAAAGGSEKIVETLLSKGFKVMTGDGYGWSPLHSAAENGKLKVVELLVNKGADINDRNVSGKTPYNLASDFEHKEVCDFLISKGADKSDQQFPLLSGNYLGQKEPENGAKVFAPDIVTTKYLLHGNIVFSPKGDEAYWSTWRPAKNSGETPHMFTSKIVDGKWTKPELASFSKIGFDDDSPFISPDGNKLFFLSRRPLKSGEANSTKENIWFVARNGNGWSAPAPIDAVNSLELHWQISTDKKGNLYFGAADPDGKKFGEIFCSKFVNGQFTKPEKLSSQINSENREGSPYISPDGDYILFDRASNQGQQMGIFISFLKKDGTWTEAKSIIDAAKIYDRSQCCHVTHDGKYMFYITGYGSQFGAFWIKTDFINDLRAKETF